MTSELAQTEGSSPARQDATTRPFTHEEQVEAADWVAISVIFTVIMAVPFVLRFVLTASADEHGVRDILGLITACGAAALSLLSTVVGAAVLHATGGSAAQQRARVRAGQRVLGFGLAASSALFVAWWVILAW